MAMEISIQFDFKGADPVDFNVVQESWHTYKLSDGSKIKLRLSLISVWRSRTQHNPITGEPLYWWNAPLLTSLISFPESFRGEPTKVMPQTPDAMAREVKEVVDFELIGKHDEWDVYNLSDGTVLRLRPSITSIARTGLHAPTGEPIYSTSSGPANARLKIPSNLIKKPAAAAKGVQGDQKPSAAYG